MKRLLILIIALLGSLTMMAQTKGSLIIKEYSADEWENLPPTLEYHRIDMDDDGEWDLDYRAGISDSFMSYPIVFGRNGACFHIRTANEYLNEYDNTFVDIQQPFNDTSLRWRSRVGAVIHPEAAYYGQYHMDTMTFKAGIRNGEEGEYYYGWIEAYCVVPYDYASVWFYLARTCYCTIPNYPLRWGQTSLTDDIVETEATALATLHPKPTTGQVTIMGQDLKSAVVFNTLGQQVATATGEGETLHIDIANLPAGVYFVNVTDGEGRKCVKKVVKE